MTAHIVRLIVMGWLLLLLACARVPDNIVVYCANSFAVYMGSGGTWQQIYTLDKDGPYLITSLAYDSKNRTIAISEEPRKLSKNGAKLLLINPNTRKVIDEIDTGLDQIRKMAFDDDGKRISLIVNEFGGGSNRKLYLLSIAARTVSVALEGELQSVSWGKSDDILLSYKVNGKSFVGYVERLHGKYEIKKIAEGFSINSSDVDSTFVYIDPNGSVIRTNKQQNEVFVVPLPPNFKDVHALSSVAFTYGSESIVLAKYGIQWDNLYLFEPPYQNAQKILDRYNFLDYAVVAKH